MKVEFNFSIVFKKLKKLPKHIRVKIEQWEAKVFHLGLAEVRKMPGYHDEPLQGQWFGHRSIRLNRKQRLIYKHHKTGEVEIIKIKEINAHDY